jgi:stage II sporulation protein M
MTPPDKPISYQRKLRPYITASLALLLVGGVLGASVVAYSPIARHFDQNVTEFVKVFRGLPRLELAAAIFLNNAVKALLVMVGGIAIGLLPAVFLIVNGAALGFVLSSSIPSRGVLAALLAILPHGVFELPAVILATSMGLLLGRCAVNKFFHAGETRISDELALALKFFVRTVVPLLLIAALVEAFVTSALVKS